MIGKEGEGKEGEVLRAEFLVSHRGTAEPFALLRRVRIFFQYGCFFGLSRHRQAMGRFFHENLV
jgi:hypothetical protein